MFALIGVAITALLFGVVMLAIELTRLALSAALKLLKLAHGVRS
jgi:hypothetical protein